MNRGVAAAARSFVSRHRPRSELLRRIAAAVALISCVAAVIGVSMPGTRTPIATVHLVDLSSSCGPIEGILDGLRAHLVPGHPDDRVAVIGFRRAAVLLAPFSPADRAVVLNPGAGLAGLELLEDGSNLDRGVALMRSLWDEAGLDHHRRRVVLWGDLRYPRRSLDALRRQHPELLCAGLPRTPPPDLRLGIIGDPRLRPGRRTIVKLVVHARGGRRRVAKLGDLRIPVVPGRSHVVTVPVDAKAGARYHFRLEPDPVGNAWPDHDEVRLDVVEPGLRRKVGTIGHWPDEVPLPQSWLSVPAEAAVLDDLDAVVVFNTPASGIDVTDQLRAAVGDRGLGLAVFGGDQAFRAGGYAGWKLDSWLPLSSRPPRGRDVHIALDRSGSMDKDDRSGRAVASIARLAGALSPNDRIQVWPFGTSPLPPIPRHPVSPTAFAAEALPMLWKLAASGGTRLRGAFEGPAAAAAAAGSDRDPVFVVLSDLKDDTLAADEIQAIKRSLTSFRGGALSLLLDPTPETTARARSLSLRVRPVRDIVPEVILHAVEGDGWRADDVVATRWSVDPAGLPMAGEVRGWNPVVAGERARVLLETADGRPLAADVRRGAGRIVACATDVALEGWLRGCVVPWVESTMAPATEDVRAGVDAEGLWVTVPRSHAGPLFVASDGFDAMPLLEVEPGRWRAHRVPPSGRISVLDGDRRLLGRPELFASDAPEYLQPALPTPAPGLDARDAPSAPPLRWPFGLTALLIMAGSVIWPPRDR